MACRIVDVIALMTRLALCISQLPGKVRHLIRRLWLEDMQVVYFSLCGLLLPVGLFRASHEMHERAVLHHGVICGSVASSEAYSRYRERRLTILFALGVFEGVCADVFASSTIHIFTSSTGNLCHSLLVIGSLLILPVTPSLHHRAKKGSNLCFSSMQSQTAPYQYLVPSSSNLTVTAFFFFPLGVPRMTPA